MAVAGLGSLAVRNFVKEMVHKYTCGSSLERVAVINGEVFDTTSTTFNTAAGATNYATTTDPTHFTAAHIDVGVLGVARLQDTMPNDVPGTFRVSDTTGMHAGSVVHVVNGAGNVGRALLSHVHRSGSITVGNWLSPVSGAADAEPGSHIIASASGSPSPAMVDTKVSSGAGQSFASGQYIASLIDTLAAASVSGIGSGGATPVTTCNGALTGDVTFATTATTAYPFVNCFAGNTITFTDGAPTQPDLQGVTRTIVANTAAVNGTITVDRALPVATLATDTFTITPTQVSDMTAQLLASPGEAGRALVGGVPVGAITEGANTGSPAANSNVTPVAALALMAAYKFGHCLNPAGPAEPNILLTSELLSDLSMVGMTLDGFPYLPAAGNITGGAGLTSLTVAVPATEGRRAIPRAGTFRLIEGPGLGGAAAFQLHPATGAGGIAFSRGEGNTINFAAGSIGGGTNFTSGARVYFMGGGQNGPKKHGFQGEIKSYDFLSVLDAIVTNWLAYTVPAGS